MLGHITQRPPRRAVEIRSLSSGFLGFSRMCQVEPPTQCHLHLHGMVGHATKRPPERSVEIGSPTSMPLTPPLHGVQGHGTKRPPERSVEIMSLALALFQLIFWPPRASRTHGNVTFEQQSNHYFASVLEKSVHSTCSRTIALLQFSRKRFGPLGVGTMYMS